MTTYRNGSAVSDSFWPNSVRSTAVGIGSQKQPSSINARSDYWNESGGG